MAESYRLSPGDRVLVQILQLENHSYVGTVDTAGDIRLPLLGKHSASGKTLDELTQDIALALAGKQIQSIRNGVTSVVVLDDEDIFLDIETYRPVTVIGAVAAPGRVTYEPGMNVRMAIGTAGGMAQLNETDRIDQSSTFRTRQAELRETEAWLASELWRINVLLTDAPSDTPFEGDFQVIADRLDSEDHDDLRRLVEGARAALQRESDDNTARIALTEKRIDFLETALSQFTTASEIEEARLQDVLELSDRGLTTVNALDNAREGALNASSRLLTTQADLAGAERELQSLIIAQQGLQEDFTQTLLDERGRVERNYDEVRARLNSLNRELALVSLIDDGDVSTDVSILLHRSQGGTEITSEVPPSHLLRPGDVIEVVVSFE